MQGIKRDWAMDKAKEQSEKITQIGRAMCADHRLGR